MSFNKTKAMQSAERYLSQGKIESAIKEYERIIARAPNDPNTQNMLGDLYTKAERTDAAVVCYTKVANHFHKQGFAKKAIAVYNKIYRLKPGSITILAKLAELYHLRGSYAEARGAYRDLAERLVTDGREADALSVWEKIAEIDPRDAGICLKIAEEYLQKKQKDEACKSFYEGGVRLAEHGEHREAADAFRRALEVNDSNWKAIRGMVKSHILMGSPEEAAEELEKRLIREPHNSELLFLLIDCYLEMGEAKEAEKATIKLVEREPANYPKLLELVDIYLENDDVADAVRILSMTVDHLLVGGDAETLKKHLDRVLSRSPKELGALRILARYHGWQREKDQLQDALGLLADAAKEAGSDDDERYALEQYSMLVPHDVKRTERLDEITKNGDSDRKPDETEFILRSRREESSSANGDGTVQDANDPAEQHGLSSKLEFVAANESEDSVFPAEQEEERSEKKGVRPAVMVGSEDVKVVESADEEAEEEPSAEPTAEPVDAPEPEVARGSDERTLKPSEEMRLEDELESIKFYIDQGYEGLAGKALAELEGEFGSRKEIVSMRAQLEVLEDFESADGAVAAEVAVPEKKSAKDEPARNAPEDAAVAEPQVSAEQSADEARSEERQPKAEDEFSSLVEEIGLDNDENETPGDFETHYNTAVAYQEMGLTEDAIREFQDAVKHLSSEEEPEKYLNCCTLLGHCFVEKEMPQLALTWFTRAFEAQGLGSEEKVALQFELGKVNELLGELDEALSHFEEVYAVDVDYRDVGKRLEKIREQAVKA